MRNFKVRWSGIDKARDNDNSFGGSFHISIEEQAKQFAIHSTSGARAPLGLPLFAIKDIVAEHLNNDELIQHQRKAPYRIFKQDNMSASKIILEVAHKQKIMGWDYYVPKKAAQLIVSCNGGTGFDWDERNFCNFLPDADILLSYLSENLPEWVKIDNCRYEIWEHPVYHVDELSPTFTIPGQNAQPPINTRIEDINDDEKLIID